MDMGSLIIGIIGLTIGIIGAIPIFLKFRTYWEMVKHSFSNDDLIFETWDITFDVKSKEEIRIYQTAKIKLKKNRPTLKLIHHNAFGEMKRIRTKIDNVEIKNSFRKDGEQEIMEYVETSKKAGESIILEDEFICSLDSSELDFNADSCNTSFLPYKCKYLKLQVIFPRNFTPSDVGFKELSKVKGELIEKMHTSKTRHLCSVGNNRKQIEWMVDYPRVHHEYAITWLWNAL